MSAAFEYYFSTLIHRVHSHPVNLSWRKYFLPTHFFSRTVRTQPFFSSHDRDIHCGCARVFSARNKKEQNKCRPTSAIHFGPKSGTFAPIHSALFGALSIWRSRERDSAPFTQSWNTQRSFASGEEVIISLNIMKFNYEPSPAIEREGFN